jgi:sugar O-acyltransferase (sialic acid O-acetyltransferase NeuD family)
VTGPERPSGSPGGHGEALSIAIFGASGFAREVASWAQTATWQGRGIHLAGFIDELRPGGELRALPILGLEAMAQRVDAFIVAVGDPAVREQLVMRAQEAGLRPAPPLVHPSVRYDPDYVTFGDGAVICAGCTLTTDIAVGRHAHLNLHCTIGHDVTLGDFTTLAPGVHVSGKVEIGRGAYLGTGAVTVDGDYDARLQIGAHSVVGAGAVVSRAVPAGATVVGVPARSR